MASAVGQIGFALSCKAKSEDKIHDGTLPFCAVLELTLEEDAQHLKKASICAMQPYLVLLETMIETTVTGIQTNLSH